MKIKDFSINFFDWNGDWAISKRSAGKRLSEAQCYKNNNMVAKHINRLLGNKYLSDIENAYSQAVQKSAL